MVDKLNKDVPDWVVKGLLGVIMVAAGGIGGTVVSDAKNAEANSYNLNYYTKSDALKDRELYLYLINNVYAHIDHVKEDLKEIKSDIKDLLAKQ